MELTLAVLPLTLVSMLGAGGDAKRGAELFTQQHCTECHSVQGKGTGPSALGKAPDLGRRLDRDYTPAGLASRMWNHAPQMWTAMKAAKIEVPNLNEQAVSDLFAYFYAARYFDKPGDAGRGKRVFEDKQCGTCHSEKGMASPVKKWKSLTDPVELVERMWNHAPQMVDAAKNSKVKFPKMDAVEMSDLLVYLQNTPELRQASYEFRLPEGGADGKALLEAKGCTKCHTGVKALDHRIGKQTLTEIAAAMWNHAPEMRTKAAELNSAEMRSILGYLWSSNFFGSQGGNAGRGEKIFSANCSECHGKSAPSLEPGKRAFTSVTMVSALWQHGPKMLSEIEKRQKAWPRLTPSDAQNLIAYLNGKN